MHSITQSSRKRAASLIFVLLAAASAAQSQTPSPYRPDIVETTPNVIRMIGPYGSEMLIENAPVVERTPCMPDYPESSRKNAESGAVVLQLLVNEKGFITHAKLVETSGFRNLDRATMIGFLGCKFKPRIQDGVPVAEWKPLRYVWNVE